MVSTGFAFGERSKIADAYARMYAPRRFIHESGEVELSTDDEAKVYAAQNDVDYHDMTNTVPYQVAKTKAEHYYDKAHTKPGEGYDKKYEKAREEARGTYGGKRPGHISTPDLNAMMDAAEMGVGYDIGTNNIPYQVAKTKYELSDNSSEANKHLEAAEAAFREHTDKVPLKSRQDESCGCGGSGCICRGGKRKTLKKFPAKHTIPTKTGSKLGVRKVLPFDKRDAKSSASKYAPKAKRVSESTRYFCIADGDRVLCTNDIGESYFNRGGTCGDMRIYESKISAMKDISKVKARRNPNSKYKVRACECIGESVQFADVPRGRPVNEGLWDGLKSIGSGVMDAAKGVGNVVGGVAKGAGNVLQGNFSQAAKDVGGGVVDGLGGVAKGLGGTVKGAAEGAFGTASDIAGAAGSAVDAAGNALQGNFNQASEKLKEAGSSALGAVANDAREADIGGGIAKGAGATWDALKGGAGATMNALKQGAGAVGNTLAAGGNVLGGGLKAVGNVAQGNFGQAARDIEGGISAAGRNMVNAGKNALNAVTNNNGQQQQQSNATSQQTANDGLDPKVQKQQGGQQGAQQGEQNQKYQEELAALKKKYGIA